MRFLVYSVLPVVMAVDFTFFSDETCSTPSTEVKGYMGSGSAEAAVKYTLSAATVATAAPGTCTTLAEEWTTKSDMTGDVEKKYAFARTTSCTEYGTLSMSLYSKNFKECKAIKSSEKDATSDFEFTLSGFTSMCHQVFPHTSTGNEVSVNFGATGPNTFGLFGKDKPTYYYKVNCNPAPGDVWAIVLSSLAIVFAFAGIGLAVVAKGK